jgi:ABC-type multidrug transport system fused ATPase/permease subunit
MSKIKLILSLLNKREKRQLFFVMAAFLVMGVIELAGVGSISPFISIVSNPEIIHTNTYLDTVYKYFNFTSDSSFIVAVGISVIIILGISNVCLSVISFITNYYSGKRMYSISMRLLEKYLRQPYIFYLNINTADLSKNILGEVWIFVNSVLIRFLQLVSSCIISLAIIILLVIINPQLALIVSAMLALSYCMVFGFVRNFLAKKGVEKTAQNLLRFKYINEIFGGIKDLKILSKEKVYLNLFSAPTKKYALAEAMSEIVAEVPKYFLETIAFSCMLGIVVFIVSRGTKIEEFLPVLTLYAFGAYRLLPTLQKIFRAVANIKFNFPIVVNLGRALNGLPEGIAITDEAAPRMEFQKEIRLENIVFKYPRTDKETIKKQSIAIKANTSIALVGPTGCGKTTFVDIILGLLQAQEGKICVDDEEIRDENRKNWQKNIGYVPQSIYLTDDTIRNNIAFGIAPDKINAEAVKNAARIANIHDFILSELENGYETIIGERGIRLSGGQRQRIGIARAVYHDPAVLILDEATSALDGLTENAIMDAIRNLSHKKTIIMIAHRLTTVKYCDMIYLMDRGVIADGGTYDELYARNTAFRKMADGV